LIKITLDSRMRGCLSSLQVASNLDIMQDLPAIV